MFTNDELAARLEELNSRAKDLIEIAKTTGSQSKDTEKVADSLANKIKDVLGADNKLSLKNDGAIVDSAKNLALDPITTMVSELKDAIKEAIISGFQQAAKVVEGARDQVKSIAQANALAGSPLTGEQMSGYLNVAERANLIRQNASLAVDNAQRTTLEQATFAETRANAANTIRDWFYSGFGMDSQRSSNLDTVERYEQESKEKTKKQIYNNYTYVEQ